ncbi:hypothetical protein [Paenibacillus abyssi]|uniref:Uncharacterized protein n=1 Tax=Paenibacillus abyssi TaxID=1340531 RepID=A0A917CHG3_9BACL|nr:hypothetical protein [Paenibacillus abyssi]GGF87634.1 hypothetical protein GCM10010916_01220 [Paenibacillus abyssi]
MEKRLTRTEMLFSIGFLFMLILAVAAFFYGVKIGSEKTESKYQPMKQLNSETGAQTIAYQQQDLVSFYHTVFLPYREFQNEWYIAMDKLRTQRVSDPESAFKELSKQAKKHYDAISTASVPAQSPLLEKSQVNTLKSLKLFEQAADRQLTNINDKKPAQVLEELVKDAYYEQALQFSVNAQQEYYASMMKWSASVDPDMPDVYKMPPLLNINDWNTLPLIVKNKIMADQLASRLSLYPFYPHDLTTRVDEFIASGQADKMKIKTVSAIVDLLISTKAVRAGDFTSSKSTLYENELLPQLPFFFPNLAE